MSFLQENNSPNLAARITDKGRKSIAQGNFNITYFQIGDSEFDYAFSEFDGTFSNPSQKVLMPFDRDSQVKYPYMVSAIDSTLTGVTYGTPIQSSYTETIINCVGSAGYISGTTVECGWENISLSSLNGSSYLTVPNGIAFTGTTHITLFMNSLGVNDTITGSSTSLVYKIGVTGNTLGLDRATPDFSGLPNIPITVICNSCDPSPVDVEDLQDPWTLNTVWSQNPAGLDQSTIFDEELSGYSSNIFVSAKEYLGYNTSLGQMYNTGTTIVNSFGDVINVLPEEQHSLSILHYSRPYNNESDFDLIFKYDDYIGHTSDIACDTLNSIEYFEVSIPFLQYERNTGSTIGARFFMDSNDYYITSSKIDTRLNQMKYRYLLDEQGYSVGKIFVNHKVIIFDDQEIVAALDYKSNRRHTLPIPRISLVPTNSKCGENGDILNPLLSGTTGQTIFISYLLEYTGDTALNGMCCNYYPNISGTLTPGDVSIKFNDNDFQFMKTTLDDAINGYVANKFSILVQEVTTGEQPDPTGWKIIDFTAEIPNHNVGDIIDPVNLRGARFIITTAEYDTASLYILSDPDIIGTSRFGDEQPFPGSVKVVRGTDLEVMCFFINLPSGYFETTQNPSYVAGDPKRITEVALLNDNKDVMVIAKASSPIIRTGSQVLGVKIDL
jgi:hypothetical protein